MEECYCGLKGGVPVAARQYTTTPVREVALGCACGAANAWRAAQTPPLPPLTADDFFALAVDGLADGWAKNYREAVLAKALAAFGAAPADAQGQILAALGMTAYAALPPADLAGALESVGLARFLALPPDDQNRCFTLAGLGV
jgi:hypothetical protein